MNARVIHRLVMPCFLLAASTALAQRLTIARVDSSSYPEIHARIYALDATGAPLTGLSEGDFTVTENGTQRRIISLSCPSIHPPEAISSVLTIDVSGSMSSAGASGGTPNIELARAAARAWIAALPAGSSECAISSFDDRSAINQDFTADRARLIESIATLRPMGGTDYNAGFTASPAGGLAIAEAGHNKRVVVFLTDGRGSGDENAIVDEAARLNATIFCVTLGMPAPQVLKNIARRTGGEYFENVTTTEEAEGIYRAILYRAGGGEPCDIAWESESGCNTARAFTIAVPSRSLAASGSYTAPKSSIPAIELSPSAAAFGMVKAGENKEMQITIAAANRPITIEKIEPVGRSAGFTFNGPAMPIVLQPGERRTATIRYTASDTNYAFARWAIKSDGCFGTSIAASAGSGGGSSIRVVAPNGGERFIAGDETTIAWDGVLPTDSVRLEYSTDDGATWRTIAGRTSGLAYKWKVPATPSQRCLARVAQLDAKQAKEKNALTLAGHKDYVLASNFSADGSKVVTASWDGTAKIWSARDGTLLRTLVVSTAERNGYPRRVYWAEFTPDGSHVLTASGSSNVDIWDASSGRRLHTLEGNLFQKPNAEGVEMDGEVTPDPVISADGTRAILLTDKTPSVWDINSGRKLFSVTGHGTWVNGATFSPDGKLLLTASDDSTARLWSATTGSEVRRLVGHTAEVTSGTFSADGRWIATASNDKTVRIWDASTGDSLRSFTIRDRHGATALRALFSPDGASILIWAGVDIAPVLYDVATGAEIRRLEESPDAARASVGFALFSPDGSHIATREANVDVWDLGTGKKVNEFEWDMQMSHLAFTPDGGRIAAASGHALKIWTIDAMPLQEDRSDADWAIIDSRPASVDVDFGRRAVRSTNDSVVTSFIRNNGAAPLHVDAITIGGANAKEFSLVSGIPPFDVPPGASRNVEFRFTPASTGARSATARVDVGGRMLSQSLRGEGVRTSLRLELPAIDFGATEVGTVRDTIVEGVLKNAGSSPVEVIGVSLMGPDTSQFSIVTGAERFSLPAGGSRRIGLRFNPSRGGRTSSTLAFRHDGAGSPALAEIYGRGVAPDDAGPEPEYTDPTTFRTIAMPNAIVPKRGTIVAADYDLIGVMAGYVPIDHVMIIAGGAVPSPQDWGGVKGSMYAAYSIGVKGGIPITGKLNAAVGFQWARSIYDQDRTPDSLESSIVVNTPYASFSYGDDDSRVSATLGYAFKQHTAVGVGAFTKNAMIASIGGDYRIARRWKVALEAVTMQTLGYIPVAATVRFFGERYAIDAGLGYLGITTNGGDAPSVPVAPVISYVALF